MILITDASGDYVLTSRGSRAMPFDRSADRQRTAVTRKSGRVEVEVVPTQPLAESDSVDHERALEHDDPDTAQA